MPARNLRQCFLMLVDSQHLPTSRSRSCSISASICWPSNSISIRSNHLKHQQLLAPCIVLFICPENPRWPNPSFITQIGSWAFFCLFCPMHLALATSDGLLIVVALVKVHSRCLEPAIYCTGRLPGRLFITLLAACIQYSNTLAMHPLTTCAYTSCPQTHTDPSSRTTLDNALAPCRHGEMTVAWSPQIGDPVIRDPLQRCAHSIYIAYIAYIDICYIP